MSELLLCCCLLLHAGKVATVDTTGSDDKPFKVRVCVSKPAWPADTLGHCDGAAPPPPTHTLHNL